MGPTAEELAQHRVLLGLQTPYTGETLRRAYLQKSYGLVSRGAPSDERERLRAAHDALLADLEAGERVQIRELKAKAREACAAAKVEAAVAELERNEAARCEPGVGPYDPRSFDSVWVNVLAPPLVIGVAVLMQLSPLGFLLQGFHVWVHEFGHATIAWLTGHRALPLPIGWTPIAAEKSLFVYCGLLFLFGVLFVAGAKERKIWPIVLAIVLALVQAALTWRVSAEWARMAIAFAGIGGEFYLSAAAIGLFYIRLPEKFRWGACRYAFLFLGAACFWQSFAFWLRIKRGFEGIPYGSLINGEEDAGGDMNILHEDFNWTQHHIIATYTHLANACVAILAGLYVFFALRLDRFPARWLQRPSGRMSDAWR